MFWRDGIVYMDYADGSGTSKAAARNDLGVFLTALPKRHSDKHGLIFEKNIVEF